MMETGHESTTAARQAGDTTPAGHVDTELKTIYQDMRTRRGEVPGYIVLLKTGRLFERIRSAEALGEIGDERGVLPLIDALQSDSSATVQYVAANALGMLADKRAAGVLIHALKAEDRWVRIGAARALGHIGDPAAVGHLIPLLADPRHDVRGYAAAALGEIGDPRAAGPLEQLEGDPAEDVRKRARKALDALKAKSG